MSIQRTDAKIIRKERLHMKFREIFMAIVYPAMPQLKGEPSSASTLIR